MAHDTFEIVTLCGSTKFKDEFLEEAKKLSLMGFIVLSPFVFSGTDGDELDERRIKILHKAHRAKIAMSNRIVVINKDDYIGPSTFMEIEFAKSLGIPVSYAFNHD